MNDVKDSAEFYRNLWAGAEARLTESQAEVARLRAALDGLASCSPGIKEIERLGWREDEVAQWDAAIVAAYDALEPTR